jgi:hypothetical protein
MPIKGQKVVSTPAATSASLLASSASFRMLSFCIILCILFSSFSSCVAQANVHTIHTKTVHPLTPRTPRPTFQGGSGTTGTNKNKFGQDAIHEAVKSTVQNAVKSTSSGSIISNYFRKGAEGMARCFRSDSICTGSSAYKSLSNGVSYDGYVIKANFNAGHNAGAARTGEIAGKNAPVAVTVLFGAYDIAQSLYNGDTTDAAVKSVATTTAVVTQVASVGTPGLSSAILAVPTVYKEVSDGQFRNAAVTVAKTGAIIGLTSAVGASAPCLAGGPVAFAFCISGTIVTSAVTSYAFDFFKTASTQEGDTAVLLAAKAAQKANDAANRAEDAARRAEEAFHRTQQPDNDLNFP